MTWQATTRGGRLEGEKGGGVIRFRGIPFARAPQGALRWQSPEPPEPWSGTRSARVFGTSAPQAVVVPGIVRAAIGAAGSSQSEDCLFLNVWTPATDAGRRPVLVWIHGGAFVLGSGTTAIYSGSRLARVGDAVVVTINYRLGALGFLNLNGVVPGAPPANLGIRDQIAALEWVRDNIEDFGGDPENVTVFGESAGAMSVGTLLGIPRARELFRRAILQSGAAHNTSSAEQAQRVAEDFLEQLEVDTLADLEKVAVPDLLRAQQATAARLGLVLGALPWQPSIDGDLLPEHPLDAIAAGAARDVPTLVGTNRDEWRLFMLGDRKGRSLDEAGLARRVARTLPGCDAAGRALAERALEAYREAHPEQRPPALWEGFQSDRIFHHPAHSLAGLQSAHQPDTYAYLFGWSPPALGRRIGACHGIELPFVFGTLRAPAIRPLFLLSWDAFGLSDRVQRAWLGFARDGDPRHEKLPDWPRYDDEASTMVLSARCRTAKAPFATALRFWSELEAQTEDERGDVSEARDPAARPG